MSKPRSTLPNPVEFDANLASALAQIGAEVDHHPLRSSALARIMRETFHGSDVGGAWDWRMAYDMMQAAAVRSCSEVDLRDNPATTGNMPSPTAARPTSRQAGQIPDMQRPRQLCPWSSIGKSG